MKNRHLVLVATGLALALALWRLGADPLWEDELLTYQLAHHSLLKLQGAAIGQWQPPFALYYFFMHFWVQFGSGEFWMRLPSALFFAATVPVAAAIARTIAGEARAGVYAAFLVATTPYMVHYAQVARGYTALALACAFALLATARLLTRYRAMGKEAQTRPPWLGAGLLPAGRALVRGEWWRAWGALGDDALWLLYIASILAAMGLHNTLVLLPFVTGAILVLGTWGTPRLRWPSLANTAIATGVIGIAYLRQFWLFLRVASDVRETSWGALPSSETIFTTLVRVYGQGSIFGTVVFILVVCLAAIAFASWLRHRKWHWLAFAGVGWIGWPALLLLASWLYNPVFVDRLLYWSVLPSRVVAGVGLHLLPLPRIRPLILVAAMALNLHAIHRTWYTAPGEKWDRLAEVIAEDAHPRKDGAMLLCDYFMHGFNYYWQGRENIDTWRALKGPEARIQRFAPPDSHPTRWWERDPDQEDASGLFPRYRKVYLVHFLRWKTGTQCRMDLFHDTLAQGGRLVREEKPSNRIRLFIYERK